MTATVNNAANFYTAYDNLWAVNRNSEPTWISLETTAATPPQPERTDTNPNDIGQPRPRTRNTTPQWRSPRVETTITEPEPPQHQHDISTHNEYAAIVERMRNNYGRRSAQIRPIPDYTQEYTFEWGTPPFTVTPAATSPEPARADVVEVPVPAAPTNPAGEVELQPAGDVTMMADGTLTINDNTVGGFAGMINAGTINTDTAVVGNTGTITVGAVDPNNPFITTTATRVAPRVPPNPIYEMERTEGHLHACPVCGRVQRATIVRSPDAQGGFRIDRTCVFCAEMHRPVTRRPAWDRHNYTHEELTRLRFQKWYNREHAPQAEATVNA